MSPSNPLDILFFPSHFLSPLSFSTPLFPPSLTLPRSSSFFIPPLLLYSFSPRPPLPPCLSSLSLTSTPLKSSPHFSTSSFLIPHPFHLLPFFLHYSPHCIHILSYSVSSSHPFPATSLTLTFINNFLLGSLDGRLLFTSTHSDFLDISKSFFFSLPPNRHVNDHPYGDARRRQRVLDLPEQEPADPGQGRGDPSQGRGHCRQGRRYCPKGPGLEGGARAPRTTSEATQAGVCRR